jgi:hypothetical protein
MYEEIIFKDERDTVLVSVSATYTSMSVSLPDPIKSLGGDRMESA